MNRRQRRTLGVVTLCLAMIAVPVLAQQESMGVLKGNPYRDVGGSCVYGGKGELLHAPKGVSCPTREDAPGGRASRTADEFAGLPPELRSEANALISSHKHIADHLVELRRAIATNDETKGLTLTDEVSKELVEHWAQEQALFGKLEAEHREH